MNRSFTDVFRRGILNTLGNWPVIVVRVAETLVLFGMVVAGIIGIAVPIFVSAGIKEWKLPAGDDPWSIIAAILVEHAALWTYLFVFAMAVALIILAVYAFVSAGVARILVDAERAAPAGAEARREQFAVFRFGRWLEGARTLWLRVFWIYNGTWGLYGLIVLVPLLITALLMYAANRAENPLGIAAAGCFGFALTVIVALPLAYVFGAWTEKAVVVCVTRELTARAALRSGWDEMRRDFLRHFLVFFLISLISAGVGVALSGFFAPLASVAAPTRDLWTLFFGPVQIVSIGVRLAVSSAVDVWIVACFAAMTGDH